ncbi:MAG: acetate--CoA ligase family protein [Thermofilaceae archaeon]|jgi:acyl-CoA synthetase (NDP forming)
MGAPSLLERYIEEGRRFLSLSESLEVLKLYGLPVVRYAFLRGPEDVQAAEKIGYPLVLKLDSPDITHKTEVGGVRVGVSSPEELKRNMEEMLQAARSRAPGARVKGFVVQELVKNAHEVIIGGLNDVQFGPVIAFGLGGIFVEVLKDVVFELAPVSVDEALRMVQRIKGYRLLEGYRGLEKANLELLAETISKASVMFSELSPYVEEMDLNPTFVSSSWVKIADARFKLRTS